MKSLVKITTLISTIVATIACAAAQPQVFYNSQPVYSNQTVLTATGNTSAQSTVQIAQLPNTSPGSPLATLPSLPPLLPANVIQASGTSVKFVVPSTYSPGVYAYRITDSGNTSQTYFLNTPQIMFIQGDVGDWATPGGWLRVCGTSVGMPNTAAILALVQNGQVVQYLTSVKTNPMNDSFSQVFYVPSGTPPGVYQVYEHNGLGGPSAWSQYNAFVASPVSTITIAPPPAQSPNVYTVSPPNGVSDDAAIAAAISQASQGGTIQLAPGTYTLSKEIVMPQGTTLNGAGKGITVLKWATDPVSGSSYLPLVTSALLGYTSTGAPICASYSVKNLSISASKTFNGYAIYRAWTQLPGTISNVQIVMPYIGDYTSSATAVYLRQTNDTVISSCQFNSRNGIYCREQVSNLRVEDSTIQYREVSVQLNGNSNNFIIDNNLMIMNGNASTNGWGPNDNPGLWFTGDYGWPYFPGAYTENFYYAHNTSSHNTAFGTTDGCVGMTFDAACGIYTGGIQGVNTTQGVTTVNLAGNTTVVPEPGGSSVPYSYVGAVMKVEAGTGMGQWAYITSASPGSSTVTINKPFAVPLDSTSVVSIVNNLGNAIFDGNNYGCEPNNQNYYFSMDVIKANNTYSSGGDTTWAGVHSGNPFSDWHFQFLSNLITNPCTTFQAFTSGGLSGYSGPVLADVVYRGNVDQGGAASTYMVRSSNGMVCDAVIEGNTAAYIGLGPAGAPLNYNGMVLRSNPGASYNIGALRGINPGSIPGVTYLP